jgi:hypothetical protein
MTTKGGASPMLIPWMLCNMPTDLKSIALCFKLLYVFLFCK